MLGLKSELLSDAGFGDSHHTPAREETHHIITSHVVTALFLSLHAQIIRAHAVSACWSI
jgi:hypothetical protein